MLNQTGSNGNIYCGRSLKFGIYVATRDVTKIRLICLFKQYPNQSI